MSSCRHRAKVVEHVLSIGWEKHTVRLDLAQAMISKAKGQGGKEKLLAEHGRREGQLHNRSRGEARVQLGIYCKEFVYLYFKKNKF